MPAVEVDAICIRHWDWSETSQTVSLLTRTRGLLRAVAKGARRPKAPYSGGVELLTRAEAAVILKPATGLHLLTRWDLVETYGHLRRSLEAYHAACYMADVAQQLVSDADPHPDLYDALIDGLRAIGEPAARPAAVLRYQYAALKAAGLAPELARALDSGEGVKDRPVMKFSPGLGGLVEEGGQDDPTVHPGRMDAPVWAVRRGTVRALRQSAGLNDGDVACAEDVSRANALLACYVRYVLGHEMGTFGLLFSHLSGRPVGPAGEV